MVTTEALIGARIPDQSDGPLGGLQIANAVRDLVRYVAPRFTNQSARNAAYAAWVADGGTMEFGMRCSTTSDQRSWLYNGTRWVKDGGGPEFLTAGAVGTGATAQPSAGDVLVGTSSIPPHMPGTLRFQIRYTWTAPGAALVTAKLQYPAGTDVPGSSTQLHNRGSTAPQSMISEGYMPSDGTARTLGLYLSSGTGGNPVSLDTMNTAVWLT